ncbi:MAG TPA: SPFH domain-containing protein, partial [Protaetiibacter sp.]|nr:SPFH domain-containing protein [Protaetiibacter sp.]
KIVVPEGYGLITMQDGEMTGLVAEPGGYTWQSDDVNSQSILAGNGILSPLIMQTWERFKRGGIPGSEQRAFYVSLKELPNNRFGTQSEIYWDDAWLGTQVGALTRGSYTLKIVDPILFVKNFVPATYLTGNAVFDFTDMANDAATQLFNEVVSALSPAFSKYTNDPSRTRITQIQSDSLGFAKSLGDAVEEGYGWKANRGLEIVSTAIIAIEYDADTTELLSKVKRADALSGARGNSNLQASVAQGIESAGSSEGGGGNLLGVGMAAGSLGGLAGLQQPVAPAAPAAAAAPAADDPMAKLTQAKQMLDAGLITQEDYDAVKAKVLGG